MPEFAARAELFWAASVADDPTRYPALQGDLEADVAIVGAGIVGLTAALLLQRAGRRVAVLEARQVGRQVTGRSTAKITSQHGLIYHTLETSFGAAGARAYGAANQAGLEQIVRFADDLAIGCDLERAAAFVYARSGEHLARLEQEAEAAQRLGLPAALHARLPAAVRGRGRGPVRRPGPVQPGARTCSAWRRPCRAAAVPCSRAAGSGGRARRALPGRRRAGRGAPPAHVIDRHPFAAGEPRQSPPRPTPCPCDDRRAHRSGARAGRHVYQRRPADPLGAAPRAGRADVAGRGRRRVQARPAGRRPPGLRRAGCATFAATMAWARSAIAWTNEDFELMDGLPFVGRSARRAPTSYVATGFNAWGIPTAPPPE